MILGLPIRHTPRLHSRYHCDPKLPLSRTCLFERSDRHSPNIEIKETPTPMRAEYNSLAHCDTMLCERCSAIKFQPLVARDRNSVFYVLHQSRSSYIRSLSLRCKLCTLISSQLGTVELEDDICEQLSAFVVLKRRCSSEGGPAAATAATSHPITIISRFGSGFLTVIDPLPG